MSRVQLDDFVAGWIGGATGVVVGHPLDTVKTRLQAGQGYGSTLSCILTVYRNEKVAGFFKGMSFPLASIAIYNSVVFGVYSNTLRFISQHRYGSSKHPSAVLDLAAASTVVGFVSVEVGGPVDLVKIRLQMQTMPAATDHIAVKNKPVMVAYRGPIHCVSMILRHEGIMGMYRGSSAMILRDLPGYCLYFIPYAFLCQWVTPEGHKAPNAFSVWMAGGIAGAISWGTATPMDVVKSRLQADGVYTKQYKGVADCIYKSYKTEGLKVFCRGVTVNAVRGFPMSAAMFLSYELSLKAMRKNQAEPHS